MVAFALSFLIQQMFHLHVLVQVYIQVNIVKLFIYKWIVDVQSNVLMGVHALMECVCAHHNMLAHHVNMVTKRRERLNENLSIFR
jgi:hypothetical protein